MVSKLRIIWKQTVVAAADNGGERSAAAARAGRPMRNSMTLSPAEMGALLYQETMGRLARGFAQKLIATVDSFCAGNIHQGEKLHGKAQRAAVRQRRQAWEYKR